MSKQTETNAKMVSGANSFISDNELILTFYDLLESVKKAQGCNAASAFEQLSELLELAAEERGAFLESA